MRLSVQTAKPGNENNQPRRSSDGVKGPRANAKERSKWAVQGKAPRSKATRSQATRSQLQATLGAKAGKSKGEGKADISGARKLAERCRAGESEGKANKEEKEK